ncbi:MAG: GNAT family N-acetyltransferase [Streptomyces sp.]|nr:GNAT family N-acetyltransferase [Streptomyces sp.]
MDSRAAAMPYLPPQRRGHDEVTRWVREVVLVQCRVWVAERGDGIAGYAALDGDLLDHLYLRPDARRQGIGTLLLDEVRRHSPGGLSLHVFQQNTEARAFYAHHGFTVAGTTDGAGNMERLPDMTLRWTPQVVRDDRPLEARRVRLARTFDGSAEDAERYDRARPGYPERMYADLARLAGAVPGSRVLEIGCGTGQATAPLAARGCRVTAVEAGPRMAAVTRRKMGGEAEVVTASFEEWELPAAPYDTVLAATAFHWIDPAVRVAKAADALRPGGALAVVRTQHVRGGTEGFFAEAQRCYERFDPDTPPGLRPPRASEVDGSDHAVEVARSRRFGPTLFRRYERDLTYTTAEYLDLLMTYSGHRALPDAAREGLLGCLAGLIDGRYGGRVTKRYLTELAVSHRR